MAPSKPIQPETPQAASTVKQVLETAIAELEKKVGIELTETKEALSQLQ